MSQTTKSRSDLSVSDYADGVRSGDRVVLARAITLIESTKPAHYELAQELLQMLLPKTGDATRVGITGVPGVGKSTTIDQLGTNLTVAGHKVAVLAVDPSSTRSGGSVLGDKTRMPRLAVDENAYVRPSPTSGTLGGVTRKTRETMALCEAAGFDVVLVETVGVGQSETAVAEMVDFFLALMLPGAGDELQGIKKGIVEIADMIAINKADGDNVERANAAASVYRSALNIITASSPNWSPPVVTISGLKDLGLDALWAKIAEHRETMTKSGERAERRQAQSVKWMHDMLEDRLKSVAYGNDKILRKMAAVEADVRGGKLTPSLAVSNIMALLDQD